MMAKLVPHILIRPDHYIHNLNLPFFLAELTNKDKHALMHAHTAAPAHSSVILDPFVSAVARTGPPGPGCLVWPDDSRGNVVA